VLLRIEWFRVIDDEYYLRDSGFRGGVLELFWITYVCTFSEIQLTHVTNSSRSSVVSCQSTVSAGAYRFCRVYVSSRECVILRPFVVFVVRQKE